MPDIMKLIQVDNGRIFALHLRAGHKWSDGTRFTTEDFRYYWQDVATTSLLSPVVPPNICRVDGELPKFRIADAQMGVNTAAGRSREGLA